eukprot:scaffold6562_cov342-Prasinococcus_capsulatus_cf.AAC.1
MRACVHARGGARSRSEPGGGAVPRRQEPDGNAGDAGCCRAPARAIGRPARGDGAHRPSPRIDTAAAPERIAPASRPLDGRRAARAATAWRGHALSKPPLPSPRPSGRVSHQTPRVVAGVHMARPATAAGARALPASSAATAKYCQGHRSRGGLPAAARSAPRRSAVHLSATAPAPKQQSLALHFGKTSVSVPASSDLVQGLSGAIAQSLGVLKEKAASKPKRWDDIAWSGGCCHALRYRTTDEGVTLEFFLNPNMAVDAFQAQALPLHTQVGRRGLPCMTEIARGACLVARQGLA